MDDFDKFWEEVLDFANEIGLDSNYVEDEFILDGELHKFYPNPRKSTKHTND